ncbi:MAG TPA: hypothetical protein PKX05_04000 [bacterium]|nr:hypothetical protein [bacterium]
MKKILSMILGLWLAIGCMEPEVFAAISKRGGSGTNTASSVDLVVATVAGLLRHPKKEIRLQALQALIAGMTEGSNEDDDDSGDDDSGSGIEDIFSLKSGTSESQGLGTTVFIPEFFTMLSDQDPQIRDLVSIGLDELFGTDVSLMRFMSDPDPIVRRYAMRLFVVKTLTEKETSDENDDDDNKKSKSTKDILIMRMLLYMTKDPDPEVKQLALDTLEKFMTKLEEDYKKLMETKSGQ